MTITTAKLYIGVPGEWVDVSDAVIIDSGFSWTGSIDGYGEEIQRVQDDFSVSIDFTMTKREHRLFTRNMARLCRRPALIHNGRKPR